MRFKSQISFLLALGMILLVQSCNDWLDLLPEDDLVAEEFWQSQEDVESVLSNAYGTLSYDVKDLLLRAELRGGLLSEGLNIPDEPARIMEGDITETNTLCKWSRLYKVINGANLVIKLAPGVVDKDPSFSLLEMHQLVSEALFLRALSYFYLVRIYKDVPLILEPYTTDEQDYYPVKSEDGVILDQIVTDLNTALEYAVISFGSVEADKGRATRYAVNALLADVYLWMDEYSQAADQCDQVIESGKYALLGASNWFENFYPGNSNSSIFEIQFSKRWGTTPGLYETFSYQRLRQYTVNPRILELFETDDVRGRGASYGNDYLEVWKYVGVNDEEERGDAHNDNNFIIYRLADVILMKAEALAEMQQFDEALSLINQVRQKRGISAIDAEPSVEAYEDLLLDERAREFLAEGKQWFDLIRIGKRDEYRRKERVIAALVLNAPADIILSLQVKFQDPYSWYLPIYRNELKVNLNLVQNPYYQVTNPYY